MLASHRSESISLSHVSGIRTIHQTHQKLCAGPRKSSATAQLSSKNPCAAKPHATEFEYEFEELPKTSLIILDRIHIHFLISPGISITNVKVPLDLLLTMRDARILHRDISINNIMTTHPSPPRSDDLHGLLIDLDLAIRVDREKASGSPDCAGTYEFLSLNL